MSKDNIEIIEKKVKKGISKIEKIKLNDINSDIGTQNNIKRPKIKKAYHGKSLQKDLLNIESFDDSVHTDYAQNTISEQKYKKTLATPKSAVIDDNKQKVSKNTEIDKKENNVELTKIKKFSDQQTNGATDQNNIFLTEFASHIPYWGGYFTLRSQKITVSITCTIDYYLFSFWVMKKTTSNFQERLPKLNQSKFLEIIISNIENKDWNLARQNWYTLIMEKDLSKTSEVDFFGEVDEFFLKYIYIYQTHNLIQKCTEDCIYNGNLLISENSAIISFARLKNKTIGIVSYSSNCSICGSKITCDIQFKYDTLFVFLETRTFFKIHNIPDILNMNNKTFKRLCSILHFQAKKHFVAVYYFGEKMFLVDDLSANEALMLDINNKKHQKYFSINISSAVYVIK